MLHPARIFNYWLNLMYFRLKLIILTNLIELWATSRWKWLHLWQIYLLSVTSLMGRSWCYFAWIFGGHVAAFGLTLFNMYGISLLMSRYLRFSEVGSEESSTFLLRWLLFCFLLKLVGIVSTLHVVISRLTDQLILWINLKMTTTHFLLIRKNLKVNIH